MAGGKSKKKKSKGPELMSGQTEKDRAKLRVNQRKIGAEINDKRELIGDHTEGAMQEMRDKNNQAFEEVGGVQKIGRRTSYATTVQRKVRGGGEGRRPTGGNASLRRSAPRRFSAGLAHPPPPHLPLHPAPLLSRLATRARRCWTHRTRPLWWPQPRSRSRRWQ